MPPSILIRLRESTAIAHQQIEDQLNLPAACQNAALYQNLLEGFFGYYEPLETKLETLTGWTGYNPATHRKTPWLVEDLRALGLGEDDIAALPRCENLPSLETVSQGFGCAYVVEGSTLGGRQISQWLKESAIPEGARNFFASYGATVGENWKQYGAALEQFSVEGQADEIIQGAIETFSTLSRWMAQTQAALLK